MMKLYLWILMPMMIFSQIKYRAGDSPFILKVGSNEKYHTVQSAIDDWQVGHIILLAPEYFNESVTLSDSGMTFIGSGRGTVISSITISNVDIQISDMTIKDFTSVCTIAYAWNKNPNIIENCYITGNINNGTTSIQDKYKLIIKDSHIFSKDKILYNNSSNSEFALVNTEILPLSSDANERISFIIDNGRVSFENCSLFFVDSIYYGHTDTYGSSIFMINSFGFITTIKPTGNTDYWEVLVCRNSELVFDDTKNITIEGKFEFDIQNSEIKIPNIIYNSTASSRISHSTQLGYQSTSTISGSALNNLYINHSIFHFAAPIGLGEDNYNSWEAFIDN